MPFNERQRRSIRERDHNSCQFPHKHAGACGVNCTGRLEVHHIVPQRYAREHLQATPDKIDQPYNAITICQNSHVGTPKSIHSDQPRARREYAQGNKNAYLQMFDRRSRKTEQGEPYWNRTYDQELLETARDNTIEAKEAGWEFPKKGVIYNKHKI